MVAFEVWHDGQYVSFGEALDATLEDTCVNNPTLGMQEVEALQYTGEKKFDETGFKIIPAAQLAAQHPEWFSQRLECQAYMLPSRQWTLYLE